VIQKPALLLVAALGLLPASGCVVAGGQVIGEWTQPDEQLVDSAPCGSHCRSFQGYEVAWAVHYPQNLSLVNFRAICRNVGTPYPCLFDEDIFIADDRLHHTATIYWRTQSSAVAVRLMADEIR
jgi:hypothetical protein